MCLLLCPTESFQVSFSKLFLFCFSPLVELFYFSSCFVYFTSVSIPLSEKNFCWIIFDLQRTFLYIKSTLPGVLP